VAESEQAPGTADRSLPQVWRISPWQALALLLLTTLLAAVDLYSDVSAMAKVAAAVVAVAALAAASCALRYLLVVDEDGIWVRRLFTVVLVEWPDVDHAEMSTARRSGVTVRIYRHDGTYVDVPPSLVLPTLPTSIPKARYAVHHVAMRLNDIAAAHRS
jgi:hypothetical protein